jgi:phage tail P2-like protein
MSDVSLLPPNASAQERAIEAASQGRAVPTPLRDLWNPDTCPAALLPWLAWALSIDAWKDYWPEHVKRARVRTAIEIQRRKGTAQSVRQVVQAFGGQVVLREWWENDPPTQPHTFDMVLTLTGEGGDTASAQFVSDVIAEVERTKPVRSHFTFTQGANAYGGIGIVAAARAAVYRRLEFAGA